jgi:protein-S-isoprenylcysteine O-methyltransferase Ste14
MGAGWLGWAIVSHYDAAPDEAKLTIVPTYLARGGAYAMTRNPMYVGGATMLAGWSLLLGSLPVAGATLAYVAGLSTAGVPFEERLLLDRFGESYDAYRRAVPRWLPRPSTFWRHSRAHARAG